MVRRRRSEPLWPFGVALAVLVAALGLGAVIAGPGATAGVPPAEVEAGEPEPEPEPRVPTPEDRVRVEVLNGGGVPGMAGQATEILRREGFDVVYFGNESSFGREASLVLDRTLKEGAMEAVSGELGIAAFRAESDPTRLVDVTVLLGSDWQPPPVPPATPAAAAPADSQEAAGGSEPGGPRPWWDLRRLLQGAR